jgi:hypothetical protein
MEDTAVFDQLSACLDVDREFLEVLIPYLEMLLAIGIDFSDLDLQQAIEGHPLHLEAACQSVLGFAGRLATDAQSFTSRSQATETLIQALVETWEPTLDWQDQATIASAARYISPYETALRYIYALQQVQPESNWQPQSLESLSDQEIELLLPQLEQAWQQQLDS